MNFLRKVLTESREADFKAKYQTKFADQDLESIIKMVKTIPNGTKFFDFVGKTMPTAFSEEDLEKVESLLKKFVSIAPNLPMTDINQYGSLQELETELKKHENKIRRQVQAIEGADIVYEDDRYTIVAPLTHNASCYYGAGTKWCTSSEQTQTHFNTYNADGKLFYIIDKTLPTSNRFYKVALLQKYDGDQTFFDAPDNSFKVGWILGTPEFEKLMLSVDSYMQDKYADKIKLYSDKAALEKERKRLEMERQAEIRRQKLISAQERREIGEWDEDLIENTDSEAARAHAFLVYLVNEQGVDEMTPEIRATVRELQNQLSQIESLMENPNLDQDRLDDLQTRKIAIEEELEEYDNYIDVYNIIPENTYYDMQVFSVVGTNEVDDTDLYAVGTYDEALQSAKNYTQELIDEMGIGAFNQGFVRNYIDYSAFESYLEDFYGEDVNNNPEVYLDESERELSYEQEKKILELETEWEHLNEKESETEDEDEIQEIIDRIDEIRDEIEEIKENPEGDFDEDAIQNVISGLVEEHANSPYEFYTQYFGDGNYDEFLKRNGFIDVDELIDGVVDADGIGATLNRYDGTEDEARFMGETYIIFKHDG